MRLCKRSVAISLAWDPLPGDCCVATAPLGPVGLLMNLNLQIRHAGVGRHPENEANRGGIWIPAQRAAQVRDDGVLPSLRRWFEFDQIAQRLADFR
jgi:hypothetical protein